MSRCFLFAPDVLILFVVRNSNFKYTRWSWQSAPFAPECDKKKKWFHRIHLFSSVLNKAVYVECFGANATLIDSLDFMNPTYTAVFIFETPYTLVWTLENNRHTQTNLLYIGVWRWTKCNGLLLISFELNHIPGTIWSGCLCMYTVSRNVIKSNGVFSPPFQHKSITSPWSALSEWVQFPSKCCFIHVFPFLYWWPVNTWGPALGLRFTLVCVMLCPEGSSIHHFRHG